MKTELVVLNIEEVDAVMVAQFKREGYNCRFDNGSGIFYAEKGGIEYEQKKDKGVKTEYVD